MTKSPRGPDQTRLFDGAAFFELNSFTLRTLLVESQALIGNPLHDPSCRRLPVLVPVDGAPESGWPVVLVLAGFSGNGPNYFNLKAWESNFPQTLDRLVNQREAPRAIYVFVDAMTYWGGSQFLNSRYTGQYEDYVAMDVVGALKKMLPVAHDPGAWCVMGGSSGGYGALHLASRHPGLFGQSAAIAPDSFFEASLLPEYRTAIPILEKLGGVRGVKAELAAGRLQRRKEWHSILNAVAMGLCYAGASIAQDETNGARNVTDPATEFGFALPLDRRTGLVIEAEWSRWKQHDPICFLEERLAQVKQLAGLYLDVGNRDQYHLQFGARQIHDLLSKHSVEHQFAEFDGGHFEISERRPLVWRWLIESRGWRP